MAVKCEKCGTVNPPDRERCRICGQLFPSSVSAADDITRCPHCQAENPVGARECSICQRRMRPASQPAGQKAVVIRSDEWEEKRGWEDLPHQARRVAWVSIGGMLVLMAGAFGLIDAAFVIGIGVEYERLDVNDVVCSALMVVFGLVAIMGGVMAILRQQFPLAVIGGVSGVFAYGCALGSLLSLIGLILIVVMRKEFSR